MPNPGSSEAKRLGCLCSALDNHFGKGAVVEDQINPGFFVVNPECPIHIRKDELAGVEVEDDTK